MSIADGDTEADELREIDAVLRAPSAGGKVIRGGALRTAGYVGGTVASLGASVVLLRYLGVVDVGRYVTVMSLLAIAAGLTDAGITIIGQREYTLLKTEEERRHLLGTLVALRLVLAPAGVVAVTIFALAAGYDRTMVLGTAIGGAGVIIATVGLTLTVPLTVALRLGAVTAVEMARQVATAIGLVVLAAVSAPLLPFFAVNIAAGVVTLVAALALTGASARVGPRLVREEWVPLLREAAPVALSLAVNVLYVRILIVLMSLLATEDETGYFATSYRILEVFIVIPILMLGSAFPLLAHAGRGDDQRLAYALQRIAEVTLLVALAIVIVLAIGAEPVLEVLGGSGYEPAVGVLQIQAFALIGAFLTQVWVAGLVAVREQRALIVTNVLALGTALALGLALIPGSEAEGAAIAAVAGEAILAVATAVMLTRARADLRPRFGVMARGVAAAAIASGAALALGVAPAVATAVAAGLFVALAFAFRAVPLELLDALRPGARGGDPD